ncbi:hypothetical protein [Pseudofrankia asymbiotica]|uniref:Uncharacterized protein n=1 Tax=Pseudofrankia asymbiotica TaxID=1834516 RepID=A0A1V2IKC4_9ACTN|nr:hypothetical protein [Pseudofrankia asymbiotica]ONH33485.1 hypothetical protein BL253_01495 [Pseudofrankia asymbiotica]
MNAPPYPIVEHRTLDPVQRRMMRRGRRNAADLPKPGAGTVLVLQTDRRFEIVPARHLNGREEAVLDAVAVYLVDVTRNRRVSVYLEIPSFGATGDFNLRVVFSCTVQDPVAVARDNVEDVAGQLHDHISEDPKLHEIGYDYDVDNAEDIVEVRQQAQARVTAWCSVRPPQIAGIAVRLINVEVPTPEDLRRHKGELRTELQRYELDSARDGHLIVRAEKYEEVVARGPQSIEAIALVKGEVGAHDLAVRERARRHDEIRLMAEVLDTLGKNGQLDRMNFDPRRIAEELSERLAGSRTPLAPTHTPELSRGADGAVRPGPDHGAADGGGNVDGRSSRPAVSSYFDDDDDHDSSAGR